MVGCAFGGLLIGLPPTASYAELKARIVRHNRALHKVEAELVNARPLLASRLATLALTLDDLLNQHDFAELYLNTLTQRDGRRLFDLPSANMAIGVPSDQINQKPHALRRGITFSRTAKSQIARTATSSTPIDESEQRRILEIAHGKFAAIDRLTLPFRRRRRLPSSSSSSFSTAACELAPWVNQAASLPLASDRLL